MDQRVNDIPSDTQKGVSNSEDEEEYWLVFSIQRLRKISKRRVKASFKSLNIVQDAGSVITRTTFDIPWNIGIWDFSQPIMRIKEG